MDEKMKEALKGIFKNLTDEQREKVNACPNADELMKLLGEWDIELPDELVDQVAGGSDGTVFDWKRASEEAIETARRLFQY